MKTTSKYNYCNLPEDQDIGEHGNKQRLQEFYLSVWGADLRQIKSLANSPDSCSSKSTPSDICM